MNNPLNKKNPYLALLMDKRIYSLFELNRYIKEVLTLNFEIPLWIEAEISQIKFSRNHVYVDLVEKDDTTDQLKAFARANIWYRAHQMLKTRHGSLIDDILRAGQAVKLLVSVTFHERYGYSLNIHDVDPEFTIGKLEIERQQVIAQIKTEKLIGLNAKNPLNSVVQRIAVLSSESAAGYQDFLKSMIHNPFDYYAELLLYPISVQGTQVKPRLLHALRQIEQQADDFDCVVIIRGGGSRLDLAAFDDLDIARRIAGFGLPILTGIGHEIDICAADVVAWQHFKTPTAVAEFILQRNRSFEDAIDQISYRLQYLVQDYVHSERASLAKAGHLLMRVLHQSVTQLDQWNRAIAQQADLNLNTQKTILQNLERVLGLVHPDQILRRGYSMTMNADTGELITNGENLKKGSKIHSRFINFTLESTIDHINLTP